MSNLFQTIAVDASSSPPAWAIVVFDIDGVVRDVSGSYRRALADTVEHFTSGAFRPSQFDIDALKAEGIWNNDWEASQELIYRYYESQGQCRAEEVALNYEELVAFFQSRYRGPDPSHWTGYICQEPLLMQSAYLDELTQAGIRWGFFSGATRGSAEYVLKKRLGLQTPILVAMEDAPSKPDATGLLAAVQHLETGGQFLPVFYVGDTVADMYTVNHARQLQPSRLWGAIGILPPHVQTSPSHCQSYITTLKQAGAQVVLNTVQDLVPRQIQVLLASLVTP